MRTVHKFELSRHAQTRLMLPFGAQITKIDAQYGRVFVWVSLDTDSPYVQPYTFTIVGTGQEIPDGFLVHSTFFEDGGAFVWHVCIKWGVVSSSGGDHKHRLGEMELMHG